MKYIRSYYAWLFLRVALGILFIGASAYKILTPGDFAHQIFNYKILPAWAINPSAIVLPWLQLVCGVALVAGRYVKGASFWIFLMMLAFQVAVAAALMRGLNISCGCFKSGGDPATWGTFARDAVLLLAATLQLWKAHQQERQSGLWMAKQ